MSGDQLPTQIAWEGELANGAEVSYFGSALNGYVYQLDVGSSFDGIELIRKINHEYGNGVVIGIISSSQDEQEIKKAKAVGAQFWIIKSDDIEPRLEDFKKDYESYKTDNWSFKIYK
jgi:DNA-binding NarL/FixJ family response regulator